MSGKLFLYPHLYSVQTRLKKAAKGILRKVSERLQNPKIREANKEEIKTVTSRTLIELLQSSQTSTAGKSPGRKPKKAKDMERD